MQNIYKKIIDYLKANEKAMLATIIWTSGSTPAPAQAKMLLSVDGERIAGTIGGGCIEDSIIRRTAALENKNKATILYFELNDAEIESGLICGGSLKVLLEPVNKNDKELFNLLSNRIEQGLDSILLTTFIEEKPTLKSLYDENLSLLYGQPSEKDIIAESPFSKQAPLIIQKKDLLYVVEPVEGKIPLFIFGGGHVGAAISKFSSACGFSVTIIDDRIEYTDKSKFPDADRTICLPFRDISEQIGLNENSFVIIVTRGHNYDEMVLEKVINYNPKYIGMIGSKKKVLVTFQHLMQRGVSKDRLSKVFAPIGLDIGAVSVDEIAISVVAELIKVRRKKNADIVEHKKIKNIPEY